ncbi:MAG: hypothetical protein LBQ15_03380 [Clostridium sp.]|jgi:hypothetical protein|nr:hypothetical protein [Clostridium sp.]
MNVNKTIECEDRYRESDHKDTWGKAIDKYTFFYNDSGSGRSALANIWGGGRNIKAGDLRALKEFCGVGYDEFPRV